MTDELSKFVLVGARFNRIVINEEKIGPLATELKVSVERKGPFLSPHKSGDREVIEVAVRVLISASEGTENIVDIECTAGFLGVEPSNDGDIELFQLEIAEVGRGVYWVLRSRLQTLFATTRLHGAALPWDMDKLPFVGSDEVSRKTPKAKKAKGARPTSRQGR